MAWWREDIAKPGLKLVCSNAYKCYEPSSGKVFPSNLTVGHVYTLRDLRVMLGGFTIGELFYTENGAPFVQLEELDLNIWAPADLLKPIEKRETDITLFQQIRREAERHARAPEDA